MRWKTSAVLHGTVILGSFIILFFSIGGFFSHLDWRLGWYGHPRPQYWAAGVLACAWLAWHEKWGWFMLPMLGIGINIAVLAPFYERIELTDEVGHYDLSILHLNTNRGEADLDVLDRFPADVLFLQEVTPGLEVRFKDEFPDYEVAISHPLTTTQGVAMLIHQDAAIEPELMTVHHMPWYNYRPLITTRVRLNDKRLYLMSLHTSRPHHDHADAFQQLEIDAAAEWSREQQSFGSEVVMVGDLNLTPWSTRFQQFLISSHTSDSMIGFGIQNSWTAFVPQWMGLPIDHAVHSKGLVVLDRQTAPVAGSDHGLLFVRYTTTE